MEFSYAARNPIHVAKGSRGLFCRSTNCIFSRSELSEKREFALLFLHSTRQYGRHSATGADLGLYPFTRSHDS